MKPFQSFFMGGYECADHINRQGVRVNLLRETQHDIRVDEDYRMLKEIGISVVREGICWSAVDNGSGTYDFSEVKTRIDAAQKHGIQQIWDLCHFGYPDGLVPTHPLFCTRFANLCEAFATFYKAFSTQRLYVIPINEISFLAWHSGDVRGTVPFAVNSGWDIKYHLCKAVLQGIKALKKTDPSCCIIHVEPLVSIHRGENQSLEDVALHNEHQFQAMDIIAGRICPELGGDESYLEILGFNYYWNAEWEFNGQPLPWPEYDPRRSGISNLLQMAYQRYKKPVFLSETGHFGQGRVKWLEEIFQGCLEAMDAGVDFHGICIYPITDRPDWDDLTSYSNCGVFDLDPYGNRIADAGYIQALYQCQQTLKLPSQSTTPKELSMM
jgi:beta-glucosidase/6-phospho-beta-glucosidase/beta-galactosidase